MIWIKPTYLIIGNNIPEKWHDLEKSNVSRTLVSNSIVDYSDVVGASPVGAAPLQLHLHSRFNPWFQCIRKRNLQDETRNISILWFGASYTRALAFYLCIETDFGFKNNTQNSRSRWMKAVKILIFFHKEAFFEWDGVGHAHDISKCLSMENIVWQYLCVKNKMRWLSRYIQSSDDRLALFYEKLWCWISVQTPSKPTITISPIVFIKQFEHV